MNNKIFKILILIIPLLLIFGCNKKEEKQQEKGFKVEFQNIEITPGFIFDSKKIKEEADISEIPNCAFGDTGIVYTYEELEITTDKNNKIYSVYFISPNITTKEGLSLGEEEEKIEELYGKDYKKNNNEYLYSKNGINLSIIVNNNLVKSIEYIKEG